MSSSRICFHTTHYIAFFFFSSARFIYAFAFDNPAMPFSSYILPEPYYAFPPPLYRWFTAVIYFIHFSFLPPFLSFFIIFSSFTYIFFSSLLSFPFLKERHVLFFSAFSFIFFFMLIFFIAAFRHYRAFSFYQPYIHIYIIFADETASAMPIHYRHTYIYFQSI